MSEPRIEQRPAQPYLAIAGEITHGVPAFVDKAFPELFASLGELGVTPTGPPFIRYREVDASGEPLAIEVGIPVEPARPHGNGRLRADALPAGRYLTLLHVGPYRSTELPDLGDARAELLAWAEENEIAYGRESARGLALACALEHYRIGPVEEPDFTKWETEFAYLLL